MFARCSDLVCALAGVVPRDAAVRCDDGGNGARGGAAPRRVMYAGEHDGAWRSRGCRGARRALGRARRERRRGARRARPRVRRRRGELPRRACSAPPVLSGDSADTRGAQVGAGALVAAHRARAKEGLNAASPEVAEPMLKTVVAAARLCIPNKVCDVDEERFAAACSALRQQKGVAAGGDAPLSADEFRLVVNMLGQKKSDEMLAALFAALDAKGAGSVSLKRCEEAVAVLAGAQARPQEASSKLVFGLFDVDGKGRLTQAELEGAVTRLIHVALAHTKGKFLQVWAAPRSLHARAGACARGALALLLTVRARASTCTCTCLGSQTWRSAMCATPSSASRCATWTRAPGASRTQSSTRGSPATGAPAPPSACSCRLWARRLPDLQVRRLQFSPFFCFVWV